MVHRTPRLGLIYAVVVAAVVPLMADFARSDDLGSLFAPETDRPRIAVMEWNTNSNADGFNFTWHARQAERYRCFVPTLPLEAYDAGPEHGAENPKWVQQALLAHSKAIQHYAATGGPIGLRTNNVARGVVSKRYRSARPVETPPDDSPFVWRTQPGTTELDDVPSCDPFGAKQPWPIEGHLLARSLYMRQMQKLMPAPAFVIWADNNEAFRPKDPFREDLAVRVGKKMKSLDNVYQPYRFRSLDVLGQSSVRLRDRVAAVGIEQCDVFEVMADFYLADKSNYDAFYAAFNEQLTDRWRNRISTSAYSALRGGAKRFPDAIAAKVTDAPEAIKFDGSGPGIYIGNYLPTDLCDPKFYARLMSAMRPWKQLKQKNPRAFRVVYFWCGGTNALAAAKADRHQPISPAIYGAHTAWCLWTIRDPGVPVLAHHWLGNQRKPTDKFFSKPENQAQLAALGRTDLANLTYNDYIDSICEAVDAITENATIAEFWNKGEPVDWPVEQGQTVLYTASRLGGKVLLYAFSPHKLEGPVNVTVPGFDPLTIDAPQPSGYWIVSDSGAQKVAVENAAAKADKHPAEAPQPKAADPQGGVKVKQNQ